MGIKGVSDLEAKQFLLSFEQTLQMTISYSIT